MKTKKVIYKRGDQRDCYEVGKSVVFKWNREWIIEKVKYNKNKDITSISLKFKPYEVVFISLFTGYM